MTEVRVDLSGIKGWCVIALNRDTEVSKRAEDDYILEYVYICVPGALLLCTWLHMLIKMNRCN